MEVGGVNKGSNGFKVDLIIYADEGDYVLLEKAKQMNIQTIGLSKFTNDFVNLNEIFQNKKITSRKK